MTSCDASCCTCFPKVSCAFVTSASWRIGSELLSCRCAFNCSMQHNNRGPNKMPLTQTTFGAALSVADRWWSSKDSPLQKSNCALHRGSPPRHEGTFSNSKSSRASTCCAPLRSATKQISPSSVTRAITGILLRKSESLPLFVLLYRTASATLDTVLFAHSIPIGPASAATTGGFLLTALSNARRTPCLPTRPRQTAR